MVEGNKSNNYEKLEELTTLTGELAHEIKNPLSTIKINLRLIDEDLQDARVGQRDSDGPERNSDKLSRALRKIAVVQKETDRLEQILDGFLRYVGKPELQLVNVDINELVGDMIDFYSAQAHSHAITIRQALSAQPLICKVDAGMLKQVILNLFLNAQQAMENGGELMIRTSRQENLAVLQITDTGKGIPPERLRSLFKPYQSLRRGGTGLGLVTAKKIVESHNGSIEVYTESGRGASFTIKLPLVVDKTNTGEAGT
jgi:signal transduction histidine kinase